MNLLKKFHDQNLKVKHQFDVFEKIDKRISAWIFCGAIQDVFIHRRFLFAR